MEANNFMDYDELLESKGFSLNEYQEGKFWEFVVENDEDLNNRLCKIFGADNEIFVTGPDIDTIILQCAEDFTKCLFYYDCHQFYMETEEFMKCVEQI